MADPTDRAIYYQRYFEEDKAKTNRLGKLLKFSCDLCEMRIQDHSKHCKSCNRCCHKFDHHCNWLNNCVGVENYNLFIIATFALLGYVVCNFIFSLIILLAKEFTGDFWDVICII